MSKLHIYLKKSPKCSNSSTKTAIHTYNYPSTPYQPIVPTQPEYTPPYQPVIPTQTEYSPPYQPIIPTQPEYVPPHQPIIPTHLNIHHLYQHLQK